MNKEMHDLVAWSIKTAKLAGADECRVGMSSSRFVNISYRERKPENIKEASTRSFGIEVFEFFLGSIGVREGLEIGDELFGPIPLFRKPTTLRNLLIDCQVMADHGAGTGAQVVTIDASPFGDGAVPVWAPKPRIQGYFLNALPE